MRAEMSPEVVPKNDEEWMAMDDARALIRARVVMADKERHNRAKEMASRMLKAEKAEQDAMQAVANGE